MFSKTLLTAALLALTVYAQEDGTVEPTGDEGATEPAGDDGATETVTAPAAPAASYTTLTDEELAERGIGWPDALATYPEYTWEAVSIDAGPSGTWQKTLFHITGNTNYPDFVPRRQPVLLVGGGTTNAMTWFNSATAYRMGTTNKQQFAGAWETELLRMIREGDSGTLACLTEFKAAAEKKRWAELSKFWKEENIVDLDQHLAFLTAEAADTAAVEAAAAEGVEADAAEGVDAPVQTQAEKDAITCAAQKMSDSLTEYLSAVADEGWRSEEAMRSPTAPLPVALFDYGYDVWVDGNRGTEYQYGGEGIGDETGRLDADNWDWDFRQMALEDQTANIDFITAASEDFDFLSYIGYSLGTRQMYWLMDEASSEGGSQTAKDALAKVDKFLSLTVCPYGTTLTGGDREADRAAAIEKIQKYQELDIPFMFGKDWNGEGVDVMLAGYEEFPGYEGIKAALSQQADTMSMQDLLSDLQGRGEGQLLKSYDAAYGAGGVFPGEGDYVDFTTITGGPKTYLYGGGLDTECTPDITARIGDELTAVERTYTYTCADHMFFVDTSVQNARLQQDMVIVLGAKALAASAAAAVAAFALF